MDLQLRGKRALVTGSTAGIGLAAAAGLFREGASVVVNGRTPQRVEEAVREDPGPGRRRRGLGRRRRPVHRRGRGRSGAATARGGHPGQQPGHLRAEAVRGDPRRRLAPVLRGQRHERRAADPPLPAGDEGPQLGPDRVRLQRVGGADPRRDDPLRHDQDGPARHRPRRGRDGRRDGHHGQLRAARPDRIGGRGDVRGRPGEAAGRGPLGGRGRVLPDRPPDVRC